MRILFSKFILASLVLCAFTVTFAQKTHPKVKSKSISEVKSDWPEEKETEEEIEESGSNEASSKATPNVAVIFCSSSGNVYVRGWDKTEVKVVSESGSKLKLVATGTGTGDAPASQVKILLKDSDGEDNYSNPCEGSGDVEIFVPRGAYVDLKTREGDVNVENVTKARLQSLSGGFSLRGIKAYTQAQTTSGDIELDDSSGQVSLVSINGSIDVRNTQQSENGDSFNVKAVSGDITLERVNYLRVEAGSISGDVTWLGALTRNATYNIRTTSGDVILVLPSNASFKVAAVVSQGHEIITDFQIKTLQVDMRGGGSRRLVGSYGTGEATLDITAVSGDVHLRKK